MGQPQGIQRIRKKKGKEKEKWGYWPIKVYWTEDKITKKKRSNQTTISRDKLKNQVKWGSRSKILRV